MNWHHLSLNPKAVDNLYGDAPPSLRGCSLTGLRLQDRGPTLTVFLEITELPERHRQPKRWDGDSNRVMIELSFGGLSAVHVEGWSVNNVTDVDIVQAEDKRSIELTLSGTWGRITATSAFFDVMRFDAYQSNEEGVG
jgi:hypothetical protein